MSVAKIIEITAGSPKGFDDAIRVGLARAVKTVEDIKGAWVKNQQVLVENGQIKEYRVDLKITFLIHE
ncbi:MAG: dodecin domain-containing protein [Verrucomicrobia bacterium]|nr:dodecin domain-containing protein [Verrucomicrobiota bacterium]